MHPNAQLTPRADSPPPPRSVVLEEDPDLAQTPEADAHNNESVPQPTFTRFLHLPPELRVYIWDLFYADVENRDATPHGLVDWIHNSPTCISISLHHDADLHRRLMKRCFEIRDTCAEAYTAYRRFCRSAHRAHHPAASSPLRVVLEARSFADWAQLAEWLIHWDLATEITRLELSGGLDSGFYPEACRDASNCNRTLLRKLTALEEIDIRGLHSIPWDGIIYPRGSDEWKTGMRLDMWIESVRQNLPGRNIRFESSDRDRRVRVRGGSNRGPGTRQTVIDAFCTLSRVAMPSDAARRARTWIGFWERSAEMSSAALVDRTATEIYHLTLGKMKR